MGAAFAAGASMGANLPQPTFSNAANIGGTPSMSSSTPGESGGSQGPGRGQVIAAMAHCA